MRFDLIDLRLFETVVRAGSISKGAARSHMALASASARIAGMEETLGAPLLERRPKGIVPTAAGQTLLHHAGVITGQVERMRGDLRLFSSGLRGGIRLLSNTAALVEIVPRALRAFLPAHPGIDVDVEEHTSAEIAAAVAAGQAEFGVLAAGSHTEALETRPLGIDRLTALVSAGHSLADRDVISFVRLLDEPFVGLGAGALHDYLAWQSARLGRRLTCRVRLRSFEAVARLIAAGSGVGILPQAAVPVSGVPGLKALRLEEPWADRRLVICARRFAELSLHARLLATAIEAESSPGA